MSGKARAAVVSIAGASGTGKSQLALAVRQVLGDDVAARVTMDWFIVPRDIPMGDWLQRPLAYDQDAVRFILDAPVGTQMHTPPFDFTTFQRSATSGDINLIPIRPVMLLDGMEPWPDADLSVLVETPIDVRRQRIVERDTRWKSRVIDRWDHLEICRRHIESLDHAYDLKLDGEAPIEENAGRIVDEILARNLVPGL